jgi:hypothetical protein
LAAVYERNGANAEEAREKAEAYLKTVGGWNDLIVTQKAL